MMAKSLLLCTALAALCFSLIQATEVRECKAKLPLPLKTSVSNCDTPPCEISRGSVATANLTFESPLDIEELKPTISAKALGVDIDYPLEEKDGCKTLIGASCPLEEGEIATYTANIEIKRIFPPIKVQIELTLSLDEGDGELVPFTCVQFDVQVR